MPVAEQIRVNSHTGNGSTTNFAYSYRIFADADLQVTVDGVLKTLTTDYTVNGANDAGGGSIDFITAPINLSVVTISGELTYDRIIDYIENGGMRSLTVDNDFDRTVMLIQQLWRDIKRSIKVPVEETDDKEVSSTAAERANKVLSFDSSGLPVATTITDLSSTLSTVDASLLLAAAQLSVAIPNRHCVAGGTVDAITGTSSPVAGSLTNNLRVMVEASGANATTTPTFKLDSTDAKTIVKGSDSPLDIGDIPGANAKIVFVFDASLDKWVLLNPANVNHKGADVASASALPTPVGSDYADVTGTTAVTSIAALRVGAIVRYHFDAALTLTHHATNLVLPGGVNITTQAGDEATFIEYATGDWRLLSYEPYLTTARTGTGSKVRATSPTLVTPVLGVASATSLALSGSAGSPPDANTLYKDLILKCWGSVTYSGGTPTLDADANISGIIDDATGSLTYTWDRDFANVNYAIAVFDQRASGTLPLTRGITRNASDQRAVGSVQIQTEDSAGGAEDGVVTMIMASGQQA